MSDKVFNSLRIVLFSTLFVWGIYTFLAYLGVPVHQAVLLTEEGRQSVAAACGSNGSLLCQGWHGLSSFFSQTFVWAGPFFAYGVVSLIAFGIVAMLGFLRSNRWEISLRITPFTLVMGFVASAWVFFTLISFSSVGGQPFTRLVEPLPEIYQGVDPEGLMALQDNFNGLRDKGCLTPVTGQRNVFDVSRACMQLSFFTNVLPLMVFIAFVLLVFLTFGRFLLHLLGIRSDRPIVEMVFSVGLGSCGLIFVLWLVALIGNWIQQPIYSQVAGWGILLVIPATLYRHAMYWLSAFWHRERRYEAPLYGAALIVGWLLVSYLALNFLNVVRPFPIGWDDLGKYINQPRLLVSYGYAIPQLSSFLWEYITSLGFLLFGFDSVFGATASMMLNWMAGLLAVVVVYAFGAVYMGRNQGMLAALLYYSLPVVGHFSFADMKVDNAVFVMGALALLAMFIAIFPSAEEEESEEHPETTRSLDWRLIILAGIFSGFAFSLKVTSIMTIMALGVVLFGATVHWTAFVGTLSLSWLVYVNEGRFNLTEIGTRVYGDPAALSKPLIVVCLAVLGFGLTGYSAYLRPAAFKKTITAAGIFIAAFFITVAPWLVRNNLANGHIALKPIFTVPDTITPSFVIGKGVEDPKNYGQEIIRLPEELRVDQSKCIGTSKSEELDRYWGNHSGWSHYLSLPWRSVMNLDSAGYYVTMYPALLLLPLLLFLPFFWMRQGKWLRWLFVATVFSLVQWVFFANGIPWYGLGMFFGLAIGLESFINRAPDMPNKILSAFLVVMSLFIAFAMRFWQYDQQKNLFEYPLGKVSYEALRERTIPHYDDIRDEIDRRRAATPERPYVFRMGTFIPYFIPKNLEVLPVADHQLDLFNCLNIERDAQLTLRRLQALGFNSMIFDTNTQTIERDPNGSLHKKVQAFVDFVNTPGLGLGVPVMDTDNGIAFILLP